MPALLLALFGFEGTTAETIFIAGFGGLLFLGLLMLRVNVPQMLMGGMLLASALTAPTEQGGTAYVQTWMLPIQMYRSELYLAGGVLLLVWSLFTGKANLVAIPFQGWMFIIMAIYAGSLEFVHHDATLAGQTIVYALITVPALLFASTATARSEEGCRKIVVTIMLVSIVWTFLSSVQFVINAEVLTAGGRFRGMLANAQGAAIFVAPLVVISLWLLLLDTKKWNRILWVAILTINILFILWTGSRTGLLMTITGATVVLYRRLGRTVLILPIAALILWALSALSDALQIGSSLERIVSTEDTREGVWQNQVRIFLDDPWIGSGWGETGGSESSYLGGAAAYGIGYVLLMLVLVGYSLVLCATLTIGRKRLPRHYWPLAELFCAFTASYFVGAAFEGYILARNSTTLAMILMFAGIGAHLKHVMKEQALGGAIDDGSNASSYGDDEAHSHHGTEGEDAAAATA